MREFKQNKYLLRKSMAVALLLYLTLAATLTFAKSKANWTREEMNLRMSGGSRIKAINYPKEKPVPTLKSRKNISSAGPRKKIVTPRSSVQSANISAQPAQIIANVIDAPPIDGFVPWIAVTLTNERTNNMERSAVAASQVEGSYIAANPLNDYAIGLFDTGAAATVMGYNNADRIGVFDFNPSLLTPNPILISGVTGSVIATVSQPLGVFVDGLGAIDPATLQLDPSKMVGQYHTSIAFGPNPGNNPDLATAIGAPMWVYFSALFRNDLQQTIVRDNNTYTSPDITLYADQDDPCIPNYSNMIPLELRPLGAISVEFVSYELDFNFEYIPFSPSLIAGISSIQSLFFVHSVDLYEGSNVAFDKDRFMIDTGAQVTVIGSRVGARLGLDPADPNFTVEIMGVTGDSIDVPGFYIDSMDIPALGKWLSFTKIPVILLDISSPEGGTLDGIIGMNLFVDLNFIFRGGGIMLQDDPALEFEFINYAQAADIAPAGGDGIVNSLDVLELTSRWLTNSTTANWDPKCDLGPQPIRDGKVDIIDFAMVNQHWQKTTNP
jgi:hypothetical protein